MAKCYRFSHISDHTQLLQSDNVINEHALRNICRDYVVGMFYWKNYFILGYHNLDQQNDAVSLFCVAVKTAKKIPFFSQNSKLDTLLILSF